MKFLLPTPRIWQPESSKEQGPGDSVSGLLPLVMSGNFAPCYLEALNSNVPKEQLGMDQSLPQRPSLTVVQTCAN